MATEEKIVYVDYSQNEGIRCIYCEKYFRGKILVEEFCPRCLMAMKLRFAGLGYTIKSVG
jgi:hypothetical protein